MTNVFLHVYMQSPRIHTGAVETVRELAQDNQLKVGSLTRLEPFQCFFNYYKIQSDL